MPVTIRDGNKLKLVENDQILTDLNHNHRERENIRLFTESIPVQDLWSSPTSSMTMIIRGASNRIQVLSDCGEAKIRDPGVALFIQKDIRLGRH